VLLVEDSPVDRLVAEGYLSRDGHATRLAPDGAEALSALRVEDIDIVVMDLRLCGASGLEIVRTIRQLDDPLKATVAIVLLTSDPSAEEAGRCVEAGVDAVIGKPFEPERLRDAMRGALDRAARRRVEAAIDAPIIDADVLRGHRSQLGDEHARQILDTFLDAAPVRMADLRAAASSGDASRVAECAHHLRGAATFVGLLRLAAAAARLERRAQASTPEGLERAARAIETILRHSIDSLRATFGGTEG
jgi:CheY-like chemotaxis protein/HPt (histidine-containing phosphotransfer) domain-containing protein